MDGFNLYHAIKDLGTPELKWFCVRSYADYVTKQAGEELAKVHYFSAFAYHVPAGVPRHQTYLRALKSKGVNYTLGSFKNKPRRCNKCGIEWMGHEEKETDVNIAVQIVEDAIDGLMDVCYVISSDSDMAPAIRLLKHKFPSIEFVTISPPNRRHANELRTLADRSLRLTPRAVELNRLPDRIKDENGHFDCPREYRRTLSKSNP